MSFDALQEKIRAKKNPTVAGLDPKPEQIPPHILKASYETYGETLQGAAEAVWTFNQGLIDALCDVVPAVKPQAACYERLGKRGDIGSTAEAYADAWLGETRVGEASHPVFNADCVTLNGYMGSDTIEPFVEACKAGDKCLFLLVKTSNPGSGELHGAIVNASRSIMCAWQKTCGDGTDYQEAARAAAVAMRDDIRKYVTIV